MIIKIAWINFKKLFIKKIDIFLLKVSKNYLNWFVKKKAHGK